MRVAEVAARAGVPVSTIKYYLRSGLLMPGESINPTTTRYDERHVERVKLIRALVGPSRLNVGEAAQVLAADDLSDAVRQDGAETVAETLRGGRQETRTEDAVRFLETLGWAPDRTSSVVRLLGDAMAAVDDAGLVLSPAQLRRLASAARRTAQVERSILKGAPDAATLTVTRALAEALTLNAHHAITAER